MSRRGGHPERDVTKFVDTELAKKVERLMINRHVLMAPFPADAMELYNMCFTPEQHAAMEVLKGSTRVLRRHDTFTLTGCPRGEVGISRVRVTTPDYLPMSSDMELSFFNLPDEMRVQIAEWIPMWIRYRADTNNIVEKVKRVGSVCTTWGQVVRIWPAMQGFLGELGAEKVHNAKAKSPYPIDIQYEDGSLFEGFEPSAFTQFDDMIAECLMLPEMQGIDHVATVIG